jgi:hypothetical protein
MEEVYNRQLAQADNAPDMYDSYITQARDATTGAMREAQQGLMGRLGAGGSSPAAASRIFDLAGRNMNAATAAAAKDKFGMVQSALGGAQTAGSGISSDLRAQEQAGINAFRASTDANSAAQQADIARQRISLDGQIASINAALGFYTPWMNMMGNVYGGAASAYGGLTGEGAYGGSSGYTGLG